MSDEAVEFEDFMAARYASLLRTAYLLTQDRVLAEDLLQTALAKCWPVWRRIDDPGPYVHRTLVNTYTSWWRRRWNSEYPTDDDPVQPVPLAAVRCRRDQVRRRRIATTGAVGLAVIASAVAMGNGFRIDADAPPASTSPAVNPTAYPDGLPEADPETSAEDHVQNGIRYRAEVAGSRLQAAAVGRMGEKSVALRWIPGNQQVDIRVFCTSPDKPLKVVLRVD